MTLASSNLDWLYHLLGYLLAAAGLLLLLWSLFYDRSRGRRRCPKCWYDMSGVPGFRCPECGKEATSQRKLLKTRRRWRMAAIGVAASIAGRVIACVPEITRDGWRSRVPSTILIASISWLESPSPSEMPGTGATLSPGKSLYVELVQNRLLSGRLTPWQRRWLTAHMIRGDRLRPLYSTTWRNSFEQTLIRIHEATEFRSAPESWRLNGQVALDLDEVELQQLRTVLSRASIRSRSQWPEGIPVYVALDAMPLFGWKPKELCAKARLPGAETIRSYIQGMEGSGCDTGFLTRPWQEHLMAVGAGTVHQPTTIFDILLYDNPNAGRTVLAHDQAELPLRIEGRLSDIIAPCPSAAIEEYIRTNVHPAVGLSSSGDLVVGLGSAWCGLGSRTKVLAQLCSQPVQLTLGVRITLLCDGHEIGSTKAWWSTRTSDAFSLSRGNEFSRWENMVLLDSSSVQYPNNPGVSRFEVRITGDGEISLRDLESDRYWQGDIVLPATWRADMRDVWKEGL